jgi:hypothetical protein
LFNINNIFTIENIFFSYWINKLLNNYHNIVNSPRKIAWYFQWFSTLP